MTHPKQQKLNLFDFLNILNDGNLKKFHELSDIDKKTMSPFLINQWLTGVNDTKQIRYINHIVNPLLFSFYQHPDLVYKLMMASCTGGKKRFTYPKKTKRENASQELNIIRQYYKCTLIEAKQYQTLLSTDELIEMAEALGEDDKTIAKLKK